MRRWIALCLILLWVPVLCSSETLRVEMNTVLHEVSPTLYGIFLEDINCAVDGGLYAELVQNRSFENTNLWNPQHADHWEAWHISARDNAVAVLGTEEPLHENNPTYLHVEVQKDGLLRISNQGFGGNLLRGGISVRQGSPYDLSLWVRGDEAISLEIALTDVAGSLLCADTVKVSPGRTWSQVQGVLTATDTAGAVLSVAVSGEGSLDLDMVSLMPAERFGKEWPGGGMRSDLVEMLRELHPRFLRFPGGCVVEGTYVRENVWDWKKSIGPVETRRSIPNTWGGMQTMGVGFYEYFCLAEELGALPVPVVHAGVLCQARDVKDPPLTLQETEAYAQDILDLIAFARDGAQTEWGSLRASMGHPEPFDLRMVAIGNENWGPAYFGRYEILSRAVKAIYPDITCIVAAGPVAEGPLFQESWRSIRQSFAGDMVDEHFYMDSDWFPAHARRYDNYPRKTQVFLGEYAAHEPVQGSRRPGNLYAALCEAAFMTGLERNSDVVVMSCYAPLLAREGEVDWTPDLIWFNDVQVFGTPSYYVQQLFSRTLGDKLVKSECEGSLFHVVTRTEREVQIKVVNLLGKSVSLTVEIPGIGETEAQGSLLTGERKHVNSFAKPDKVVPQTITVSLKDGAGEIELPPSSLLVLQVPKE